MTLLLLFNQEEAVVAPGASSGHASSQQLVQRFKSGPVPLIQIQEIGISELIVRSVAILATSEIRATGTIVAVSPALKFFSKVQSETTQVLVGKTVIESSIKTKGIVDAIRPKLLQLFKLHLLKEFIDDL
jgi:hypothetical protein